VSPVQRCKSCEFRNDFGWEIDEMRPLRDGADGAVGTMGMGDDGGEPMEEEVEVAAAPSMRLGGGWAALAPESIAYMQSAMQSF
jgi:hypothetical protein